MGSPATGLPADAPDDPHRLSLAQLERRLRELDARARGLERALAQQESDLARSNGRLAAEQSQRHELIAAAERARNVDAASGLPNRASLAARLEQLVADHGLSGRPAAVMVIGIDQLSSVRESLGFSMADQVAQRIGKRLVEAVPRSALVARVGDDAFALCLATPRPAQDAAALARRLIEVIDGPVRLGEHDLRLIATIGVALLPEHGTRAEMLLTHAQAAMRYAREHGTRLYEFFRTSIGHSGERRLRLEAELRRAIDRGEFVVHYQPRRRLRCGRIVGVEALLRWDHPERGMLAAGEFIEVAAQTGLITPIGEAVLHQACSDAARWPRHVRLAVNLSAREFRGARLENIVDRALADSGLQPGRFLVELTEASLQGAPDEIDVALVRLTALRDRGVQLVLDNFGTGSGSLDLLRRCRAEYVKISAQLIRGLGAGDGMHAVVRAIAALARHFGATVIAEGIEEPGQLGAALRAGCSQGQGYYLGRPATAAETHGLLLSRRSAPQSIGFNAIAQA